ncbi:MAG TPA: hypothetical protein VG871_14495 [Vicinamibacterales bacterium]|nr:hypothetical protein [Vicinamibacterales bacterium]
MKTKATILAVAVALIIGAAIGAYAQIGELRPVQPPVTVTSGDIGFRIEGYSGDKVVGHMVVRVDGKWIDAQAAGGPLRLASR